MMLSKKNLLFKGVIFRFLVKLQGCKGRETWIHQDGEQILNWGHVFHKLLSYPAFVCEIKSSTQKIRCSALMAILNRHSKHGHQPANIILMFLSAGQPTLKRLSQAAVQFFVIFWFKSTKIRAWHFHSALYSMTFLKPNTQSSKLWNWNRISFKKLLSLVFCCFPGLRRKTEISKTNNFDKWVFPKIGIRQCPPKNWMVYHGKTLCCNGSFGGFKNPLFTETSKF